jgi:hypothetical protein
VPLPFASQDGLDVVLYGRVICRAWGRLIALVPFACDSQGWSLLVRLYIALGVLLSQGRCTSVVGDVVWTRNGGREAGCVEYLVHLRLVFTLRRQEPCYKTECDNYCEANEGCPATTVSFLVLYVLKAQTDPFAIVYVRRSTFKAVFDYVGDRAVT